MLPAEKIQINGFYDVRSNRILWRNVVNDANVSDWQKLEDIDGYPQTVKGLQEWMFRQNVDGTDQWDLTKLKKGIAHSRNPHVWDYGQRVQFWIPLSEDMVEPKPRPEFQNDILVVCINATGLDELTEGREYNVVSWDDDLMIVVNDLGERKAYFPDRFKRPLSANDMKKFIQIFQ